jgi:hypothetical protein
MNEKMPLLKELLRPEIVVSHEIIEPVHPARKGRQ